MSNDLACPVCSMTDLLASEDGHECVTCGHEWAHEQPAEALDEPIEVRDANGNLLEPGDSITLTRDLKVKGSSKTLKAGTKVKGIRLVDPDQNAGHDIDAKADGMGVLIRSKFVKKA